MKTATRTLEDFEWLNKYLLPKEVLQHQIEAFFIATLEDTSITRGRFRQKIATRKRGFKQFMH